MKVIRVLPYTFWRHKISGRTASICGAHPACSNAERDQWELVTEGYTWETDQGTYGLGRVPAKTLEEAEAVMRRFNGIT